MRECENTGLSIVHMGPPMTISIFVTGSLIDQGNGVWNLVFGVQTMRRVNESGITGTVAQVVDPLHICIRLRVLESCLGVSSEVEPLAQFKIQRQG